MKFKKVESAVIMGETMVESEQQSGAATDGVARRAVLKSVATVGFAGTAAAGTASAGGSKSITFQAANETFSFQLIVTGEVETTGGVGSVLVDDGVQVAGSVVQGSLSDGDSRTFQFTGDISILQVSGRGKVKRGDEVIRDTTKQRSLEAEDTAERLPKEVIVSSPNTDELLEYVFEVTGDLKKLEPNEDGPPAKDEVIRRGNRVRVEGAVSTGDDRFAFSGEFIPVENPSGVRFDIRRR